MQLTEGLVFLTDVPLFSIKLYVHNILGILSVVSLVHVYPCLLYTYLERHAEDLGTLLPHLAIANIHVISEAADLVLHTAVFALNGFSIFQNSLVSLIINQFSR